MTKEDMDMFEARADEVEELLESSELLIKSKARVAQNGEVFTPRWTVRDMTNLDGVREETFRIDSKILEPSCGNGNFLVPLLLRKLVLANPESFDIDVVRGVATIYGVDIQPDNIYESRNRMFEAIKAFYSYNNRELSSDVENTIKYILNRNIIIGNTLTSEKIPEDFLVLFNGLVGGKLKAAIRRNEKLYDTREYLPGNTELKFSEWEFNGNSVTRREYCIKEIDRVVAEYNPIGYDKIHTLKDILDDCVDI